MLLPINSYINSQCTMIYKVTHLPNHIMINLLFVHFFMILFSSRTISLDVHEFNNETFETDNHQALVAVIIKWWQMQSVTTPLDCKYAAIPIYTANKLFDMIPAPEVKSFSCTVGTTYPHLYFEGTMRDGYLEDEEKLVFINETEWSKMSPLDIRRKEKIALSNLNVCSKTPDFRGRWGKEIVGTFKNGLVHGMAKITYKDNSFSIGSYKNGKTHGYMREFDPKSTLLDVGGYEIGFEVVIF